MKKAKLMKGRTDDGLIEMHDDILLGKEYLIDEKSICIVEGYNHEVCVSWKREMVRAKDGGWLPTELLEIQGD